MKRLYTAILILSVILGASLFALIQCYQFQQQAIPLLQQVLTDAESGRLTQAAALAKQFNESWQTTKDSMVWYIRHEPLERITDIAARLEYLARYDDVAQLTAQTSQLLICVDELYDNELPSLKNLA